MKFFYQSGAMGYGDGYKWHKYVTPFPEFPIVTKTLTFEKKVGKPWAIAWLPFYGKSTWNKVSLHNPGLRSWIMKNEYNHRIPKLKNIIVSIHGSDYQIQIMCDWLKYLPIMGIELNYSCPNVKNEMNFRIPKTEHDLYLKLNHTQDPTKYDLSRIKRIHINSHPTRYGGISGQYAQQYNWDYIEKWVPKIDTPIAGCSWTNIPEIEQLRRMGCEYVGIASQMLTKPSEVRKIPKYFKED